MARRWIIDIRTHSPPDKEGRQSLDVCVTSPNGKKTMQTYYAEPESVVARLRHNLAEQFWFDRKRTRLAKQF